jgi:dihydroorotase
VAPAQAVTGVRVFFSAALTRGQKGEELSPIEELAKAGVVAFTDDGKGIESDAVMLKGFERLQTVGLPFLQHAEVPGHGGVLAPSKVQQALGVAPYPAAAESDMVRRDLELLKKAPRARYHVLHVSAKETVPLLEQARRQGFKVSGEASPHHLFFTGDEILENNTAFKMNPPLRASEDRAALIQALALGQLDFVATDHAPHEVSSKSAGFEKAPFGTTGLETALRVLIDLWQRRLLTSGRLVEVFAQKPAEFLGLEKEFGQIEVGRPFYAVLVDVNATRSSITTKDLESLSENNCFVGASLGGRLLKSFIGEKIWNLQGA